MSSNKNIISSLFQLLASVQLTIVLLIIITIAAILGSLFPYISPHTAELDIYSSIWFRTLILLLAINIIVCSIYKYPIIRELTTERSKPFDFKFIESLKNSKKFRLSGTPVELSMKISQVFSKKGFTVRQISAEKDSSDTGEISTFIAEKGRYSRYVFYITHLSLLLILAGSIIGSTFGFKGYMQLPVGATKNTVFLQDGDHVIELPFQIHCQDFTIEHYENSEQIKDYFSTLVVLVDGKEVKKQTIEVNHPLVHDGVKFFQSSYGQTIFDPREEKINVTVSNEETGAVIKTLSVSLDEAVPFDKESPSYQMKLVDFVGDFVMNPDGKIGSRSMSMNNPAVRVQILAENELVESFWVFTKFPDLKMGRRTTPYHIKISFPESKMYTGLQVSRDPGIPLVWTGGILLSLGIMLVFFTYHRRYFVIIEKPKKGKLTVGLAAKSHKNRLALEQEFSYFLQKIEREVETDDK